MKTKTFLSLLCLAAITAIFHPAAAENKTLDPSDIRIWNFIAINKTNEPVERLSVVATNFTTTRQFVPRIDPNGPYADLIRRSADKHKVCPHLIKAVIKIESNWDRKAVSPKGAMGLMQVMPNTAKELNLKDPFDPEENIDKCTGYLAGFIRKYRSIDMALMAYHWGEKGAADEIASGTKPHTHPYVRSVKVEWRKNQG